MSTYADCYRIMRDALRVGGLRIEYPQARQAYTQRHRFYRARKAAPGEEFSSLILQIEQPKGHVLGPREPYEKDQPGYLIVRLPPETPTQVTDLYGNPVTEAHEPDDELSDAVLSAIRNLNLE